MTAPPLNPTKLTCRSKKRHASEYIARAAAMAHLERHSNNPQLWVYQCPVCSGWHLTGNPNRKSASVTRDEPFYGVKR